MRTKAGRTPVTILLDPDVRLELRRQRAELNMSVSDVINNLCRQQFRNLAPRTPKPERAQAS